MMMSPVVGSDQQQQEAAAARVASRVDRREERIDTLRQPGGIAHADEPIRVATRIDRLSHYYPDVRPVSPDAIEAGRPAAVEAAGAVLERIIQTNDLLGVSYLEGGSVASRAVARVSIRDERGRLVGYGTGSMVTPELFLTNHHVLPDGPTAESSCVEFDYQDGPDGRPLPLRGYPLDPQRFFLTDAGLDFTLVAVKATPQQLSRFGYNQLTGAEGKAIVGDFVSIVQHPEGGKKQVALRENRVVDVVEAFMHYETDTEPGSSGSPVFNDQWEVVALHHASVPAPGQKELGGIVNEGLRVSRLVAFLHGQALPAAQQSLLDRIFTEGTGLPAPASMTLAARPPEAVAAVTLTVPFDVRLRVDMLDAETRLPEARGQIAVDPDYADRTGFDTGFLGEGYPVALPALHRDQIPLAAINSLAGSDPRYVLPYHHFSIVLNKQRRLAFFTAVNIDGNSSVRLRRVPDRWSFDPRVPRDEQAGEQIYRDNPLDRGHLVRRLDPAWGATRAVAKTANDDTFHFTNCTPQHKDFNENKATWAGLEDYILENADNRDLKASVFTGPVLAPDDDEYRGVQLPRQFWKVVVMVKEDGDLSATGYLLSQEDLVRGLEVAPEKFCYGAYRTFQVPLAHIESLTNLFFGNLTEADPLAGMEAAITREISDVDQIVL